MVMNNIKKYNKILSKDDFVSLQNLITSVDFPWFYSPSQVDDIDSSYLFHSFFHKNRINSPHYYHIIKPLLDILKPLAIINIRANLLLARTSFNPSNTFFKKNYVILISFFEGHLNYPHKLYKIFPPSLVDLYCSR